MRIRQRQAEGTDDGGRGRRPPVPRPSARVRTPAPRVAPRYDVARSRTDGTRPARFGVEGRPQNGSFPRRTATTARAATHTTHSEWWGSRIPRSPSGRRRTPPRAQLQRDRPVAQIARCRVLPCTPVTRPAWPRTDKTRPGVCPAAG